MKLRNKVIKYSAIVTTAVASSSVFAAGDPIADAITAAVTKGQTNYSLVVVGIIGLAAIGFGVGMIVSSMRK
ncbi:hypothetical protein ACTFQF_16880 [Aliivibrio fischeri]|uniref:hypothetical protein n=1 Tax=Aliivibrio fischeri TaxID=668 RepID=UPI0007C4B2C4|nr:hypothetical protein [Aliivibrio fischeri]MBP3140302.1 hypothetical protein [Aliivibrio fischeri]MBP3140311.1 hypothetical protein [Aliivibrio fischeri]MBP3154688.1 hypothetical protein [Aliivibrio fischeri]